MCLNCLPQFEKCAFCISLKVAAVLISLCGLICTTCLIVLTYMNKMGLTSQGSVNYKLWFICIMLLWLVTFIIIFIVASGLVQNENARDVLLQIYFWLSVTIGGIQLIFCVMLLVTFWNGDLTVPIAFISTTVHIFFEVYTCFFVISLRVGMLLMSVLAIMTGVMTLSTLEKSTDINYDKAQILFAVKKPSDAIKKLGILVTSGISAMSCVFMFTGVILLIGTLIDNEGVIQIFVWVTFLNVIFGYLLVLGVGYQCLMMSSCILSDLDWLSGSAFLVLLVGYLSLWIYFIAIANTYVICDNV